MLKIETGGASERRPQNRHQALRGQHQDRYMRILGLRGALYLFITNYSQLLLIIFVTIAG